MVSEKRLIDANAITYRMISYGGWGGPPDYVTDKDFIDKMPTVDAVEVVRCKDCKHLKYGYQCYYPLGMNLNNDGDAYVLVDPDDDFCSYGERKDNENQRCD